jgi:hypothetical protein
MTGSSRWDRLNLDSSGRIWAMRCLSDRIHTMKCLSYWVNELKCLPLRVYRMIVLPNNFQETIHFCQYSYQEVVYWSKTWDSSLNFKYIFLAISYLPQTSLRTSPPLPRIYLLPLVFPHSCHFINLYAFLLSMIGVSCDIVVLSLFI